MELCTELCAAPEPKPFQPISLREFAQAVLATVQDCLKRQGVKPGSVHYIASNRQGDTPPHWQPGVSVWSHTLEILWLDISVVEPFNQHKPQPYRLIVCAQITRNKKWMVAPCRSISVQTHILPKVRWEWPEESKNKKFVLPATAKVRPILMNLASELSTTHSLNLCREPQPAEFSGLYWSYDKALCDQRNLTWGRVCVGDKPKP